MRLIEAAWRGLRLHRRSSLALAAAAALCALVLSGAIGAGESIRASLLDSLEERLGPVEWLLFQPDRAFMADLEQRLSQAVPDCRPASAVWLAGTLTADARRLPGIQVMGIAAAPGGLFTDAPAPGEVWISRLTADRLAIGAGDEVLCQVSKPSFLPSEAPMGGLAPELVALRLRVGRIRDGFPQSFSPRSDQRERLVAVVNRDWLATRIGWEGRANLLLAGRADGGPELPAAVLEQRLRQVWTLADAGYRLEPLPDSGRQELISDRVFIEDRLGEALAGLVPAAGFAGVYTWFSDRVSLDGASAGASASYVFVGSGDAPFPGLPVAAGEIVLTDWLARRLGARTGQNVTLEFRLPDAAGALASHRATFEVARIIPVPVSAEARDLMPRFPGMVAAGTCRQWDPGMALDLSRLDDRDEAYWQRYRGTPQAYLNLAEARGLFSHPFGTHTAIRVRSEDPLALARELARAFPPQLAGFQALAARREGFQATVNGVDFSGLFLGLNALLMLAGLFLAFRVLDLALRRRQEEFAIYRAIGWPRSRVSRLILAETLMLAIPAALVGGCLGLLYDGLIIHSLNAIWTGVANQVLRPAFSPLAPLEALALTTLGLAAVSLIAVRRMDPARRPKPDRRPRGSAPPAWRSWGVLAILLAAVAIGLSQATGLLAGFGVVESFFTAGFLVVAAMACGLRALLASPPFSRATGDQSGLLRRDLNHQRRRIFSAAVSLAGGIYLVLGIGGYLPEAGDLSDTRSGSGGFSLLVHSTEPLSRDDLDAVAEWQAVGVRVRDGDDASCLNIRRSANPPLYGVDPGRLRGRFSLAGSPDADPWALLLEARPDGAIPVLVDGTVLQWGLGKSVGDRLVCLAEDGRTVDLVIAGALADSIFQGALLLDEARFRSLFPSESGYRLTLLARDPGQDGLQVLQRRFRGHGLWLETSAERLARLQGVERGYLAIFLVLGSLALALASLGFAIQLYRKLQDDADQICLLGQLGWPRWRIGAQVWSESFLAWAWGAGGGIAAAWLALQGQAERIAWAQWWTLAAIILASGFLGLAVAALSFRPAAVPADL